MSQRSLGSGTQVSPSRQPSGILTDGGRGKKSGSQVGFDPETAGSSPTGMAYGQG